MADVLLVTNRSKSVRANICKQSVIGFFGFMVFFLVCLKVYIEYIIVYSVSTKIYIFIKKNAETSNFNDLARIKLHKKSHFLV